MPRAHAAIDVPIRKAVKDVMLEHVDTIDEFKLAAQQHNDRAKEHEDRAKQHADRAEEVRTNRHLRDCTN
jgi:hypothetical protein